MTRISKQQERRMRCPRKNKKPSIKTGSLKDNLTKGYKPHSNSLEGTAFAGLAFIPKIK